MEKYNIHKDFKFFKNFYPPVNNFTIPIINFFLKLLPKKVSANVLKQKIKILTLDKYKLNAYLYEPKNAKGNLPCLVYFHGGGFVLKNAPYQIRIINEYCIKANCKVLFVDYRLAPKNAFPVPFNDCFCALQYVFENSNLLKINKNFIAVGGDSAGGNLATCVCLKAVENGLNVCSQLLLYPVIDNEMKSESMQKFVDTPMWNAKLSKKMWKYYLKDKSCERVEFFNPLKSLNLAKLPKTFIETAEFDCLRDEAINYASKLKESGVKVEVNETKQTIHGYDIVFKSKITQLSLKKRIEFLKESFLKTEK